MNEHPGTDRTLLWSASLETLDATLRDAVPTRRVHPPRPGRDRVLRWLTTFLRQVLSPITLILIVAALIAATVGDTSDALVILVIVAGSALLGTWREGSAGDAVAALASQVAVTVEVERAGQRLTLALPDVMPGDRVSLVAGSVVPGDARLIEAQQLEVDESALTGESFPASKRTADALPAASTLRDRVNVVYAGTHVVSGTGTALVVRVGGDTEFGHLAAHLSHAAPASSFALGIRRFGFLLLWVMLALVAAVLAINVLLHRPFVDSLLFALALAVGITPQMLPVIVSVSLTAGARRLARGQVIVKRLESIEDLGALTVLCTDKTGTITEGSLHVEHALSPAGDDAPEVLELAALNARLQSGYPNPMDLAILAAHEPDQPTGALGQIPYDFSRKRMSVLVDRGGRLLVTKGSAASVLDVCARRRSAGQEEALDRPAADRLVADLGGQGLRVIAIATRTLPEDEELDPGSERDLVLEGFVAFADPLKPDAAASIAELGELDVALRIITGDDRHVAGAVSRQLGIDQPVALGAQLASLKKAELHEFVRAHTVFAEVEPEHKALIVRALRECGETVGFLGDGINDAPAIHTADAGLSVDTAVDVAKQAADIVLLTRDLSVVALGVRLGRQTFANTMKYIRVASSANFGNILSMVGAALLLPFLPMLPAQILLLNFIADIPNTLVSRDRVDRERLVRPGRWDMRALLRFMLVFGVASTAFDLLTFAVLVQGFGASEALFHSGWFAESALTQLVAMFTLRTSRPFWRSRPDGLFLGVAIVAAVVTVVLPFSPVAPLLGLVPIPPLLLLALVGVTVAYGAVNEGLKRVVRF